MITEETLMREIMRAASSMKRMPPPPPGNIPPPPPRRHTGYGHILAVLSLHNNISQQELADFLCIRPQSLSQALTSLEAGGMVIRGKSDKDRRKIIVSITDAGAERCRAINAERLDRAKKFFSPLSEREKDELHLLLSKLFPDGGVQ